MGADAQTLITNEVLARLADMNAAVSFERIPATLTYNNLFRRKCCDANSVRQGRGRSRGQLLQQQPKLNAEIITNAGTNDERSELGQERGRVITEYLAPLDHSAALLN